MLFGPRFIFEPVCFLFFFAGFVTPTAAGLRKQQVVLDLSVLTADTSRGSNVCRSSKTHTASAGLVVHPSPLFHCCHTASIPGGAEIVPFASLEGERSGIIYLFF